jgi:hypothetical protein
MPLPEAKKVLVPLVIDFEHDGFGISTWHERNVWSIAPRVCKGN